MVQHPFSVHITNRYDRANSILRSLPPGLPFSLYHRIYLRRLRRSSQVTNKSAGHLAYVLALRQELKMGIAEDQRPCSPLSGVTTADKELGQIGSQKVLRKPFKEPESVSRPESPWRVFASRGSSARRTWLMKQGRRYRLLENTEQIESANETPESSSHEGCSTHSPARRRGFHSALRPVPIAKHGPKYLTHTMNLYMDGEPDSELFEGEGTDTAKEHQDDEVDSGLREGDGDDTSDEDGLEMILGCRSTPSLPLKGSESSSKREPLDVPRTWLTTDEEGGTPNEVIEESTWFKGNSDSGLVTIWNSFRSKPSTSKPFDSDANTVYEYPKSESSKTFKDRGPPSSHLDDGPTLKETPKSPPAKSTTSKQRLIVLSEWKPYISSNPNPFQKSSRPTVVLPSSQRSEIKKAPEVRGPIGCPMAETLINPHRAVERQQDPNSYSSFLKAHVLNETVEGPPPNYSRPLRPKRTSSEPNHNTRLAFRKESSYSDLGYIIPPDIQTLMFRVERDAACIPFMPSTYDPTRTPHVNLTRALRTKDLKVIWRECGENLDVASTFALNSKKWKVSNERWREVERLKQETEIVGEELEGEKLEGGTLEE